jgi:hypothetical protein
MNRIGLRTIICVAVIALVAIVLKALGVVK